MKTNFLIREQHAHEPGIKKREKESDLINLNNGMLQVKPFRIILCYISKDKEKNIIIYSRSVFYKFCHLKLEKKEEI